MRDFFPQLSWPVSVDAICSTKNLDVVECGLLSDGATGRVLKVTDSNEKEHALKVMYNKAHLEAEFERHRLDFTSCGLWGYQ